MQVHDDSDSELKSAGGCSKALGVFVLVCLVLLGLFVAWYLWAYPSGSFRYEMIVTVEADGKIFTGSSVMGVSWAAQPPISSNAVSSSFKGEAVMVDIGDRGTLFVLLTGRRCCEDERFSDKHTYGADPEDLTRELFDLKVFSPDVIRGLPQLQASAIVHFDQLPMLVVFADISNPKTVRVVDPNDLEASFGDGISLKSVHIETTDKEISTGIVGRLPWLMDLQGGYLSGAPTRKGSHLSNALHVGNFKTGGKWW